MFALTQLKSFWSSFFQKTCGVKRGRAPEKTALFFLRSFFFCASCVKRKSERMKVDVVMTQRTMFAQSRLSRQTINAHTQLTQRNRALCTSRKERSRKVFAELFSKSDKEKWRFSFCKAFSFAPLVSKEKAIE